jgi:hypothetical protein
MHAQEKKEQELEWRRDEFFNKLWPMAPRRQWKAKVVSDAPKENRVKIIEEQGDTDTEVPAETEVNWSDGPATPVRSVDEGSSQDRSDRSDTPVRLVTKASAQIEAKVLAPSQGCARVPASEDDEEEMLDYEP